jgi:hypothetical protein
VRSFILYGILFKTTHHKEPTYHQSRESRESRETETAKCFGIFEIVF